MNPIKSQHELVTEMFSDPKPHAEAYHGNSPQAHFFVTRLTRVYELLSDVGQGIVLDVGCGPGMAINYLADRHFQYFGLDLSKAMVDECQRHYGHCGSVYLIQGALETLPFPDGFFNGVLCLGVIEYLPNIDLGIKEISRITKPDGIVIISMLNRASPYRFWREKVYRSHRINVIRKRLKRPMVPDPLLQNVLSKHQLECKLAGYRLQVTDFVYYDFNLLLAPLDRFFPKLAVNIARRLEFLGRTRFANMGSGFIVKSIKMQN